MYSSGRRKGSQKQKIICRMLAEREREGSNKVSKHGKIEEKWYQKQNYGS